MSWVSSWIRHNRDFAGNALKNISPLAFLIPGVGPLAAAGLGAAGSALGRGIQHGGNFGNILKQGVEGGSMAYGGAQGLGALKAAFAPSSSAVGAVPGVNTATGAALHDSAATMGGLNPIEAAGQQAGSVIAGGTPGGPPPSFLSKLGSFAVHNPSAIGEGLQGLGQLGSMGANNRLLNAQAGMTEAQLAAYKNRQAALQPLYAAFLGQQHAVAPNPYYSTGRTP